MDKIKSQIDILLDISSKLDTVIGFQATRGMEGDSSAVVEKLNNMGLSARTIAPIANLSENAVNIRLTRLKKKSSKKSQ